MNVEQLFERYRALQAFVGWTDHDGRRVAAAAPALAPLLRGVVDDFYAEVERHEATRSVITGGAAQVERLKGTLLAWLHELLSGRYDARYVAGRWRVGRRHVELGLDQAYTNAGLSRIRTGLLRALHATWHGDAGELLETTCALNRLLDLDLALVEEAYQEEYLNRHQRVERLAALGQVAGGVAHELRNPLNVVKTSVYYLLNVQAPAPEKVVEHLRRIDRHVELADGVITALSSFARMPSPHAGPLSLAGVVREALELNPLPPSVELRLDLPADLPPVWADPQQLQIVIGNLLRNACDAMPRGGPLTVAARGGGDVVEVDVTDSGVGIAPDDLARITEPLFTTKSRGLGLGLAITRAILDKNRGELRVASELGRGSTFTVRLATVSADQATASD